MKLEIDEKEREALMDALNVAGSVYQSDDEVLRVRALKVRLAALTEEAAPKCTKDPNTCKVAYCDFPRCAQTT